MKKFEQLTDYIAQFDENPLETTFTHTDVDEGFLQAEYNMYSPLVDSFMNDVMKFVEEHPGYDLYNYSSIIDSYETDKTKVRQAAEAVDEDYLNTLDARGVLAWIVSAVRAEKFREGALYTSIRKGYIKAWLTRLCELDV